MENMDETHFLYDLDDYYSITRRGPKSVDYTAVVSGGTGMTLVLRLSGGLNSKLEAPFFIFKNENANYPIAGSLENVPGVCYRTQRSGWMDRSTFPKYLREPRAISALPGSDERILFVDYATGHDETPDTLTALSEIRASLRKLPANSKNLCQPLDSFIIKCFKGLWREEWEKERKRLIENNQFSMDSGKLLHPTREWYMRLALECVQKINERHGENGLSFPRKAMFRCGLSLDIDGIWRRQQLFQHLQDIINKYPTNFEGTEPVISVQYYTLDETDSE